MNTNSLQLLSQISSFLNISGAKFTIGQNSPLPVCVYKNKTTKGFFNIIQTLAKEVDKGLLIGQDANEQAEVYQWIEYCLLNAAAIIHNHIVKELNEVFISRTYLVSCRLTIADVLLYYALYNVMESMNGLEKEKSINLCRWFDNIQQDKKINGKNKIIDFSTNYLAVRAPARH